MSGKEEGFKDKILNMEEGPNIFTEAKRDMVEEIAVAYKIRNLEMLLKLKNAFDILMDEPEILKLELTILALKLGESEESVKENIDLYVQIWSKVTNILNMAFEEEIYPDFEKVRKIIKYNEDNNIEYGELF
ncbi:hypothetical protein IX317_001288 [Fusobacterium sp. DD29]|uniref:hypothetical protein n=1 Tax=unclassified Fusobacterium TaxID=2648384 RepID=UPI001B8C6FE4|nr:MULTISPECIES: hypothetical protein [unclassified Fusobacterium]MBR8701891.1 hypothetical protein [Fusobacterium sp. DD45]MBR8711672.1 hypothetical protein [Fusobacterium sp. DD28]MBR8749614.1 hypothetical protein [Fusobacterium sp. DD29]MBR8752221.1 hypothetical protein [Fusobacterium sp. DD26]MBR8761881.1 hypothetical protein [Fusobacterium sp. DD25]